MLGKLVKYDLKAAAKIFFLIHAVYLVLCFAARFLYMDRLNFSEPTEPLVFSLLLFISLMVLLVSALSIITWLQVAFRFYRNLFSREGYLSWTLPVSGPQHLWAKIISGYILMAADLIIISAGILLLTTGRNVTTAYAQIADGLTAELGYSLGTLALIMFIVCLISCISSIIMIYFSVAVGQLFPSHRVLGAIAAYFITSFVLQIISVIFMLLLGYFPGYSTASLDGKGTMDYMFRLLALSFVLMLVITVAQYIATHYIMKKKINLL